MLKSEKIKLEDISKVELEKAITVLNNAINLMSELRSFDKGMSMRAEEIRGPLTAIKKYFEKNLQQSFNEVHNKTNISLEYLEKEIFELQKRVLMLEEASNSNLQDGDNAHLKDTARQNRNATKEIKDNIGMMTEPFISVDTDGLIQKDQDISIIDETEKEFVNLYNNSRFKGEENLILEATSDEERVNNPHGFINFEESQKVLLIETDGTAKYLCGIKNYDSREYYVTPTKKQVFSKTEIYRSAFEDFFEFTEYEADKSYKFKLLQPAIFKKNDNGNYVLVRRGKIELYLAI